MGFNSAFKVLMSETLTRFH